MSSRHRAKSDCYSSGERAMMACSQQVRGRLFSPLLDRLAACGVRPDHLTLLSLLAGLAFCPLYFWSPAVAMGMLALHVLLDGLDGPLARHTRSASRRGSFTDTVADQVVIAATTVTLISAQVVGPAAGSVYVFLYTVVVLFAMARNALAVPYSWLVRPRFFVYAWILVETYAWSGTIDYVLWGFSALLASKMASGFYRIRHAI